MSTIEITVAGPQGSGKTHIAGVVARPLHAACYPVKVFDEGRLTQRSNRALSTLPQVEIHERQSVPSTDVAALLRHAETADTEAQAYEDAGSPVFANLRRMDAEAMRRFAREMGR